MLPVAGENDGAVEDLSIPEADFRAFVDRHGALREAGIAIVPEDNDAMTDSYLMIGPDGRFFGHVPHVSGRTLEYGPPILEAGFSEALRQTGFSRDKFHARGGAYDWLRPVGEAAHA